MCSCGFIMPIKDITLDQKLQNSLFLNEFNTRWKNGENRLVERCESEFKDESMMMAEAKFECIDQCEVHHNTHEKAIWNGMKESSKAAKRLASEGKKLEPNNIVVDSCESSKGLPTPDTKGPKLDQQNKRKKLSSKHFKVSEREFQSFLTFGINYFIRLEKNEEKRIQQRENREKSEKIQEGKRAHEIWLEKKQRKEMIRQQVEQERQTCNEDTIQSTSTMMRNHPHLIMSPRLLGVKNEVAKMKRRISTPKIWVTLDNITDDTSNVTMHWKNHVELSASDFFVVTLGKENESSPSKVWRDPPEKGGKLLKLSQTIELSTASSYWISIRTYTPVGMSPENRIIIPCRPNAPSAPILLNSTESTIKISWMMTPKLSSGTLCNGRDTMTHTFYVGVCVDDEKDQWINVWKGQTNVATICGLSSDTGYKFRVHCTNLLGLHSLPGNSSIAYTSLRPIQIPKLQNLGKDFIELSWDNAILGKEESYLGYSVSPRKAFRCIDANKNGWIPTSKLDRLLSDLGIICSESLIKEAEKTLSTTSDGKIYFDKFIEWWKSNITYTVTTKYNVDDEDTLIVYKGSDTNVTLREMKENNDYFFEVSCATIRGSSLPTSTPLHVKTLPIPPSQIMFLHVQANVIILKILFDHECKIKVEKIEEVVDKTGKGLQQQKASTVYEGNSNIVKIISLRSNRSYKFRCQCLNNMGGKSDFLHSDEIRTSKFQFILDQRRIASLFTIDCTNDIVEGDLIFFTEQDSSRLLNDEFGAVCIVARILSIHSSKMMNAQNMIVKMEVCWTLSTYNNNDRRRQERQIGIMIERCMETMKSFEILRMPWVDETKRK